MLRPPQYSNWGSLLMPGRPAFDVRLSHSRPLFESRAGTKQGTKGQPEVSALDYSSLQEVGIRAWDDLCWRLAVGGQSYSIFLASTVRLGFRDTLNLTAHCKSYVMGPLMYEKPLPVHLGTIEWYLESQVAPNNRHHTPKKPILDQE